MAARHRHIRLAMHTDSVQTFLRTLKQFPDMDQLRIEGRVLNEEQKNALEESQTYKFYLSGRFSRSGVLLPTSLRITPEIIVGLLQSPFSPSSLEKEIGYKTGYFNAGYFVRRSVSESGPNYLLPIIGGVNELHIGSDTLSVQRLSAMAEILHQAFIQQEQSIQSLIASMHNTPGFTNYSMQTLFPKIKNIYTGQESKMINNINWLKDKKEIYLKNKI